MDVHVNTAIPVAKAIGKLKKQGDHSQAMGPMLKAKAVPHSKIVKKWIQAVPAIADRQDGSVLTNKGELLPGHNAGNQKETIKDQVLLFKR